MKAWLVGEWNNDDGVIELFRDLIASWLLVECRELGKLLNGLQAGNKPTDGDLLLFALARKHKQEAVDAVLGLGARTILYRSPREASIRTAEILGYAKRYDNVIDIVGGGDGHLRSFTARCPKLLLGRTRAELHKIVLAIRSQERPVKVFPSTSFDPRVDFRSGLEAGLNRDRMILHDPAQGGTERHLLPHVLQFLREADVLFLNDRPAPLAPGRDNANTWIELGVAAQLEIAWTVFRYSGDAAAMSFWPSNLGGVVWEEYIDELDLATQLHFDVILECRIVS